MPEKNIIIAMGKLATTKACETVRVKLATTMPRPITERQVTAPTSSAARTDPWLRKPTSEREGKCQRERGCADQHQRGGDSSQVIERSHWRQLQASQSPCFDFARHGHGCQEDEQDHGEDERAWHVGLELGARRGRAQRFFLVADERLLSRRLLDVTVNGGDDSG